MRKIFTFMVLAFTFNAFTMAQLSTFLLDDFGNGLVNFTTEVHNNPPASFDYAVVDNPFKTEGNPSSKVWEWDRYDTGDNQQWAGFWAILTNPIPTGYTRIEVKFLRTNATSQLRMKCEGSVNLEFNPVTPASKTNEWETLVFDLVANGIKNINVLSLFPDYYSPIDIHAKCYIDDIKIVYDPTVTPPQTPSTLTLFDNSTDNRYHDQSFVNQTAPSTVNAVLWSDPTQLGDKLPVVTSPVKAGTNALKFDWTSVTGGDWMGMVASIGWKTFDLTTMKNLNFWVNSPVTLAKSALPKIYLEAFSGTPNITGKLSMVNYLATDLVADTWTLVTVPLADFWAADPTFTAKDVIKDVFFSQNATDNIEHIMYLDEFTFDNGTTGIFNPSVSKLNTYYSNGEIHIFNFSGNVQVFDVAGKLITNQYSSNGIVNINLSKGIYFVNTKSGNSKLAIL